MINLIVASRYYNGEKIYKFEDFDKAWRVYRRLKTRCVVSFVKDR